MDRDKAFRKAGRHTALVRSLRFLLPIAAVVTLGSYTLFMQRSIKIGWGGKSIEVDSFSISKEGLVAHDPRYTGFDKQGGAFEVRAKTGEQDLKQKGIVRLKGIDGNMIDAAKTRTDLKAVRGTLDTNTNVLEMFERIDVASQNGMTAELTQATVYTKENRIVSSEPVVVRMPTGTVRGQAMTIEQRQRKIEFSGGVVANLKAAPKAAAVKPVDPAMRGGQDAATPVRADAPIDITSAKLLIDDNAKLATFTGKVVAKQNDQILETSELEVAYDGQAMGQATGGQPAGQPAAKPAAPGEPQGRLRRLVAKSDVVLTRGLERATGSSGEFDAIGDKATLMGPVVISGGVDRGATADRADIDNKTDAILLTGNVVVTQQRNVLKGRRLFADRKQGTVQLSSPAIGPLSKGQVSARLYQGDADAAPKKTAAAPPAPAAPAAKKGAFGSDLRGDPSQPIDIDADTLDVDDKKKTAIFRGKVRAVQGEYVITTEQLVATYAGDAGLALTPQAGAPAAGQPMAAAQQKSGAQLQSVVSPSRAKIITKDGQRAEGDHMSFDPKANVARLTGNVLLTEGNKAIAGACAILDMNSGSMRLTDACGYSATAPAAAVTQPVKAGAPSVAPAAAAPAAAAPAAAVGLPSSTGRAQALFYPNQMKDEQREKAKASGAVAPPAPSSAAPGAAKTPAPAAAPPAAAQPERTTPRRSTSRDEGSSVFGGN